MCQLSSRMMRAGILAALVAAALCVSILDAQAVGGGASTNPGSISFHIGEAAVPGIVEGPSAASKGIGIIVPGGGDVDENGNAGLLVNGSSYKLLAQELAARGLTVIRFRKGRSGATGTSSWEFGGLFQAVSDAQFIVSETTRRWDAPCAWLIGHSEGGLVSAIIAQSDSKVCGVVLIGSPGRSLGTILRWRFQTEPLLKRYYNEASSIIGKMEDGSPIDYKEVSPLLRFIFNERSDRANREAMSVDPLLYLRSCSKPVLIVQGGRDIQVTLDDAYLLKGACPRADIITIASMNHFMKDSAANSSYQSALEYSKSGQPISLGLSDAIMKFILDKQ